MRYLCTLRGRARRNTDARRYSQVVGLCCGDIQLLADLKCGRNRRWSWCWRLLAAGEFDTTTACDDNERAPDDGEIAGSQWHRIVSKSDSLERIHLVCINANAVGLSQSLAAASDSQTRPLKTVTRATGHWPHELRANQDHRSCMVLKDLLVGVRSSLCLNRN